MTAASEEAWTTPDVEDYRRTRFRSLDQRIVDRLERRALGELVHRVLRPGDRVLDVPSGYGRLTGVAEGGDREIVAADISREMLAASLRRTSSGSVRHCGADALDLPFRDGSFDGAMCVRLVQHLPDAEARARLFGELARVTARWAVVSAYRRAGLHHLQRRLLGRGRMCVPLARIRRELTGAGFEVERVSKPLPVLHAQTLVLLRRVRT